MVQKLLNNLCEDNTVNNDKKVHSKYYDQNSLFLPMPIVGMKFIFFPVFRENLGSDRNILVIQVQILE